MACLERRSGAIYIEHVTFFQRPKAQRCGLPEPNCSADKVVFFLIRLSLTHNTASCGMANHFFDEKYSGLEISIRGVLIRPQKKANCDQRYNCSFAI